METDVLPSSNVLNEGFSIDAGGEGDDDASIGDILKLILALCEVLFVITKTLTSLAFAS
jgi:hypothetical protein